jgi:thiosulfate/3-mercaptopyruvate sulfurtransferase
MYTTLITADQLEAHLGDAQWVVLDCRHDLADYDRGRRAYRESHIPGAFFLHLDEDLSGTKTGLNGRHPLPDPRTFALRMGAIGIGNATQVVAYDASGGPYGARLWWMLRWIGHTRVAVLDGGWPAWVARRSAVSAEIPLPQPTTYTPTLKRDVAVDARFLASNIGDAKSLVLDARSPDRFRGENETLDPVAGHIPGAANRFFRQNLEADGSFKSADQLRGELSALIEGRQPAAIVHQCGSGVTACHNLLAMEHAGLTGSRLYPGSWSDWVSDRSRPVVR